MPTNIDDRTVYPGQTVNLDVHLMDASDQLMDADSTPSVSIVDRNGTTVRALSSSGVVKVSTGIYRFSYALAAAADAGTWQDTWNATVNGVLNEATFSFSVLGGSAISEGGVKIGDSPLISFTQEEIRGVNVLIEQLRCRLRDTKDIMKEAQDDYGNIVLENCPIWSDSNLFCFLRNSLSEFNQTPHFTGFTFADQIIWDRNAHVLVEGAYILALGAGMLAEAGREFTITENGITMQPPPLSNVMNNQFGSLLSAHAERLKYIKTSMKPAPLGVGTFRTLATAPALMRLRHLRQRQII